MAKVKIFFSPHLDDVVFSCAGQVLREVEAGFEVIVATLFSEGEGHAGRREEDAHATAALGARSVWLGLLDAPFRNAYYDRFTRLLGRRHVDEDAVFVADIAGRLQAFIEQHDAEEIFAPLGVGSHVDHGLCFEAVSACRGRPLYFYEDRPYAHTPGAVQARLHALGARWAREPNEEPNLHGFAPEAIGHYVEALRVQHYVKTFLPPGAEAQAFFAGIERKVSHPPVPRYDALYTVSAFDDAVRVRVQAAIEAYTSQAGSFFVDFNELGLSPLGTSPVCDEGVYCERIWRLDAL